MLTGMKQTKVRMSFAIARVTTTSIALRLSCVQKLLMRPCLFRAFANALHRMPLLEEVNPFTYLCVRHNDLGLDYPDRATP